MARPDPGGQHAVLGGRAAAAFAPPFLFRWLRPCERNPLPGAHVEAQHARFACLAEDPHRKLRPRVSTHVEAAWGGRAERREDDHVRRPSANGSTPAACAGLSIDGTPGRIAERDASEVVGQACRGAQLAIDARAECRSLPTPLRLPSTYTATVKSDPLRSKRTATWHTSDDSVHSRLLQPGRKVPDGADGTVIVQGCVSRRARRDREGRGEPEGKINSISV